MELNGKNYLVTGGSSGLGQATAEALIKAGAKVAITGRDKEKLEQVAQQIGAKAIHADVANPADVERTYDEFLNEFGQLDGLINNAGIGGGWGNIADLDIEAMRNVYDVNVFGAAMMGQKAADIFRAQNHGDIVNIASTASLKGYGKGTVYASSKFALRGMTQCWQADLRPHNVRVVQVNPSEVPTAFGQDDRQERPDEDKKLSSKEIADTIVSSLQLDNRGFIPEVTVWATNPF